MLLMGKLTISTGPFSIANCWHNQRVTSASWRKHPPQALQKLWVKRCFIGTTGAPPGWEPKRLSAKMGLFLLIKSWFHSGSLMETQLMKFGKGNIRLPLTSWNKCQVNVIFASMSMISPTSELSIESSSTDSLDQHTNLQPTLFFQSTFLGLAGASLPVSDNFSWEVEEKNSTLETSNFLLTAHDAYILLWNGIGKIIGKC